MKFVYILEFIVTIAISNVYSNLLKKANISNERKKKELKQETSKSMTSDDGSGSWKEGFKCPKVTLTYAGKTDTMTYQVFKAPLLASTSGDAKLGWVWETDKVTGGFDRVMVKGSDGKFFFPFRIMKGDATYVNPVGDYKTITMVLINDDNVAYTLKVFLPYATIGRYINDEEGNKITSLLNSNSNKAASTVRGRKTIIQNAASQFETFSQIIAGAQQSIDQQKATLQSNITAAEVKVKEDNSTLTADNTNLANLQQKVADLQAKIQGTQSSLDNSNTQIKNFKAQLETLNSGNTDAQKILQKNKDDQAAAKKRIEEGIASLIESAPSQKKNLDDAQAKILGLTKINDGIALVSKVAPRQ